MLTDLVQTIHKPVLFWLDAHYSAGATAKSVEFGNTPIQKELEIIFSKWKKGSVIIIDDAGHFNGTQGYPTVGDVEKYVLEQNASLRVVIRNNAINIF